MYSQVQMLRHMRFTDWILAGHAYSNTPVALKVLKDKDQIKQFLAEASVLMYEQSCSLSLSLSLFQTILMYV